MAKKPLNVLVSPEADQRLRSLAAESGLPLGVIVERAVLSFQHTAQHTPQHDMEVRMLAVEARLTEIETRLSAMPTEAKERGLETVSLMGKWEVAGRPEDAPDQSGSRENAAQKRSLHGTTDDEFDAVARQYRRDGVKATGRAMREAGFSFPEKRLSESLKRIGL